MLPPDLEAELRRLGISAPVKPKPEPEVEVEEREPWRPTENDREPPF